MPRLKLSLSAKIGLSNALMALLVFATVGVSIAFIQKQVASADRINDLAELTSRDLPGLMLNVKNI
ncbi:hypothetical protein [Bradyrhizobium sp.]|uniref:hypothetical protein n=1 Tax=Bradyrhizobium sp. TaxID=376 RepID=UPI003C45394F